MLADVETRSLDAVANHPAKREVGTGYTLVCACAALDPQAAKQRS